MSICLGVWDLRYITQNHAPGTFKQTCLAGIHLECRYMFHSLPIFWVIYFTAVIDWLELDWGSVCSRPTSVSNSYANIPAYSLGRWSGIWMSWMLAEYIWQMHKMFKRWDWIHSYAAVMVLADIWPSLHEDWKDIIALYMKVPIKVDVMNKQRHKILNDFMHHCTLDQYFTNQHWVVQNIKLCKAKCGHTVCVRLRLWSYYLEC